MSSPLEKYNERNINRWDIMVDFPAWEEDSILYWIKSVLHKSGYNRLGRQDAVYNPQVLADIQKNERIVFDQDFGIDISSWITIKQTLFSFLNNSPNDLIIFIELLIKYIRDTGDDYSNRNFGSNTASPSTILAILEKNLSNGSKWAVVFKKNSVAGLTDRVNPQITEIAKNMNNKHIDDAWAYAFGPNPKPEQAIIDAQAAIESIASKTGLTNTTTKVYGSIIGDIKTHKGKLYLSVAKPEFDLGLLLTAAKGETKNDTSIDDMFADWFYTGMDLIQKANPSRHKSKSVDGFEVSVDAARQSILIATVICEMIDKKYINRRNR